MYWWLITVTCICTALLIQYLCSSKILRMKQAISLKAMALRDAREQEAKLGERETELHAKQSSLTHSIERLNKDVSKLRRQLLEKGLEIPEPSFPLEEVEEIPPEDSG